MQDGGRRYRGVRLLRQPVEGRIHEHADPQITRVVEFQPHLRRMKRRVHDRRDVAVRARRTRSGKAFNLISTDSPIRTNEILFSKTSQITQTFERSEMVN